MNQQYSHGLLINGGTQPRACGLDFPSHTFPVLLHKSLHC